MNIDTLLYLTVAIPWGVACFMAGVVTGTKVDLWSRNMTQPPIVRPTETPSRNPRGERNAMPWYRRSNLWIGSAVAAIGIFTSTQWYLSGQQAEDQARRADELSKCIAAYSTGFADAIDARSAEAAKVTEGQDRLWLLFQEAVNSAPSPELRERFRIQINEYFDARQKSKQAQIENPYPKPPRDVC